MTVLAGTRAQRYEIGTNPKGAGTPAAWTLLLPRLDLRTAVVVGSVADAERDALGSLAEHLVAIETDADAALAVTGGSLPAAPIDLVRLGRGGQALLDRAPQLRTSLAARLSDRASTFVEWRGAARPGDPLGLGAAASAEPLVLRPALGPARLLAPARLADVAGRLPGARRATTPAARPGRWMVRVDRVVNRVLGGAPLARWTRRGARLVTRSGAGGPPAWIAELAATSGVDIGGWGWALLAPGDYATQKVLLALLDPTDDRPRTIVKISSSPLHRGRLRAEADALTRLATVAEATGHVPVVEFAGEHAGREIVGERWISGRPFEAVAAVGAGSPQYAAARAWLAGLATATAHPREAREVGAAVRDLFDRFRGVAPLGADELATLEAAVAALEAHAGTIPTVFQHGDPGTWNLVLDGDRVVFLDWESAEPDGLPLWDLFHLQRSFAALTARRGGARGADAGLELLIGAGPLRDRFAAEIAAQMQAVGLASELVWPLFVTCWMHRALKEVTRRTPATLERAPYLRFLRTMLARRDDPDVRALLHGGAR